MARRKQLFLRVVGEPMSLRNVRFYDPADASRPAGNIAGATALSSDMSIATHRRRHRVDYKSRESSRVVLALADAADRERIYHLATTFMPRSSASIT